jgi:hypothetical protein
VGLALTALGILASGAVFLFGWIVWVVPHLRVLLFIGVGVLVWCVLRMVWWISLTPVAESWSTLYDGLDVSNPFSWNYVGLLLELWTDMTVLCIQIVLCALLLNNWVEALAHLANAESKMERMLRGKRVVLFWLCVLCCVGGVAMLIYATVTMRSTMTAGSSNLAQISLRQNVLILFRVFAVIALF